MTSNILSPVEKMSSEHLATARQKLEYLFSVKDQLDKMAEEIPKAYKEIEKDKYFQHFLPSQKIVVFNTLSVLQEIVGTELSKVCGNGFDVRTNRFDEDMTRALLDSEKVRRHFTSLNRDGNVSVLEELFEIMAHTNMSLSDILGFFQGPQYLA
ncbi:hypothetical protein TNCV_3464901 [Trichonephila clavipes]|nr:hypothetical protein TNCV_3464901 [Trichonephila clavipes]